MPSNYETPPSYHDFPHARHLLLSLQKHNILSYLAGIEGNIITEREDLKVCEWCGGLFVEGFKTVTRKKLYPQHFCSYECNTAIDYCTTLFIGVIFAFGSILLLIGSVLFPIVATMFSGFPIILYLVFFGQMLGWPLLWCAKGSSEYRHNVPRHSRKGRLVDEPLEYHDY